MPERSAQKRRPSGAKARAVAELAAMLPVGSAPPAAQGGGGGAGGASGAAWLGAGAGDGDGEGDGEGKGEGEGVEQLAAAQLLGLERAAG